MAHPNLKETKGKNEQTKYRLAESIKECMKTTAVDNITIRQIVENCSLSRQTFYRNFLDKYDLINWYFDILLLKSFARMGKGKTVYEGLTLKFTYIQNERVFFATAFRSDDRNSLKEHDFELILKFYRDLIKEKSGKDPGPEIQFLLEMYCRGSVYMTIEWVLGDMKHTPSELAALMVKAMPEELKKLFIELKMLHN